MTTTTQHPLAAEYLRRLERAARGLPRAERRELVEEIGAHLNEAIDPGMSEAEARTVLERLGEPDDIIDAERPDAHPTRRAVHEWSAILLVLFGGFVFVVGWIAGVILLWSSRAWTTRDKLIGTLIVPGGLAGGVWIGLFTFAAGLGQVCSSSSNGGPEHCTGGPSTLGQIGLIALLAFLLLGPICTSIYLARRAR
jgi:hypothetical protein